MFRNLKNIFRRLLPLSLLTLMVTLRGRERGSKRLKIFFLAPLRYTLRSYQRTYQDEPTPIDISGTDVNRGLKIVRWRV